MMDPLLLLPDFLLILGGFCLCRYTAFGRPTWDVVERLVYHLLFPALLFASIVRSPLQPGDAATLAGAGVGLCLLGLLLATWLRHLPGVDATLHASGAQVAFRFNSYIALALADRLLGAQGVALIAILIALCVPLCNAGAVWSLARHGGPGSRPLRHCKVARTTRSGWRSGRHPARPAGDRPAPTRCRS